MTYWLFDPCIGSFRRLNNFDHLHKVYCHDLFEARRSGRFKDWPCSFSDHSIKTISSFYDQCTGEILLKSRYAEPRDLYRAAFRAGLMQRFFSGVKPVPTRRYYDKSSS